MKSSWFTIKIERSPSWMSSLRKPTMLGQISRCHFSIFIAIHYPYLLAPYKITMVPSALFGCQGSPPVYYVACHGFSPVAWSCQGTLIESTNQLPTFCQPNRISRLLVPVISLVIWPFYPQPGPTTLVPFMVSTHAGGRFYDVHAKLQGPCVADLVEVFRDSLKEAGASTTPRPSQTHKTHGVRINLNIGSIWKPFFWGRGSRIQEIK